MDGAAETAGAAAESACECSLASGGCGVLAGLVQKVV